MDLRNKCFNYIYFYFLQMKIVCSKLQALAGSSDGVNDDDDVNDVDDVELTMLKQIVLNSPKD